MATHAKSKRYIKDWKKKPVNKAVCRYLKELILEKFVASQGFASKNFPVQLITECNPPILMGSYECKCENSRKHGRVGKKDLAKPGYRIEVKEVEEIGEYQEKLPSELMQPEKEVLEKLLVRYPIVLVESFVKEGNPFACQIWADCQKDIGLVVPNENCYKEVWFYKDPLGTTHGPFSPIEMFNWSAAGYFTDLLQVSTTSVFISIKALMLLEKSKHISAPT